MTSIKTSKFGLVLIGVFVSTAAFAAEVAPKAAAVQAAKNLAASQSDTNLGEEEIAPMTLKVPPLNDDKSASSQVPAAKRLTDDDEAKPAREIKKKKKINPADLDNQVAAEEKIPTTEELDPVPHYLKALTYINEKKYANAERELNLALDRNNSYYDAWLKLALVYELTGRRKAAIREYKELLDVKPDLVEAHINLGTLLRQEDDYDAAAAEYEKVIASNYYLEEAHYNLGNVLAASGKLEPALKEFQVCLKLEKNGSEQSARVHNNIGVIYQKRNYLEDAEEEFLKALRMEPGNKTFEFNLDLVRKQLNQAPVGAFKDGHRAI